MHITKQLTFSPVIEPENTHIEALLCVRESTGYFVMHLLGTDEHKSLLWSSNKKVKKEKRKKERKNLQHIITH